MSSVCPSSWTSPWKSCSPRGHCISIESRVLSSSAVAGHGRDSWPSWAGTWYMWFNWLPRPRSSSSQPQLLACVHNPHGTAEEGVIVRLVVLTQGKIWVPAALSSFTLPSLLARTRTRDSAASRSSSVQQGPSHGWLISMAQGGHNLDQAEKSLGSLYNCHLIWEFF